MIFSVVEGRLVVKSR